MSLSSPESPGRTDPTELAARLVELLALECIDVDLFRGGRTLEPWTRVFGGQVIGQALMAACRTVDEDRLPHSLHAYFVRPGDPESPILYEVERDRDGRSFTSRRVVARQHGKPILNLAASFHIREPGLTHQVAMPDVPGPDGLANERQIIESIIDRIPEARRPLVLRDRPLEFRPIYPNALVSAAPSDPSQAYWFRVVAPLPDDQILHRVALAYASDMMLLATSMLPHDVHWLTGGIQEASLDHAIWMHDDVRVDDWLLYTQDSPWSGGARGMNRGLIFSRDGRLVATVMQEGLIRPRQGG